MSKNSTYDIFAQSFFNLTIFQPCLTIMMSVCKARAPAEGGMMKTLPAQNFYKLIFFEKIIQCNRKLFIGLDLALWKTLGLSSERICPCKARARSEGGMIKISPSQNWYELIFFEKIIHCNRKLFIGSDFALWKTLSLSSEIICACKERARSESGIIKIWSG